jgi:hypothetical protein
MFLLRFLNLILLLSFVGCLAGAMAGLIVFAPFVGGAWFLTLIAIMGSDGNAPKPATGAQRDPQRATEPVRLVDSAMRSRPVRESTVGA